jgi:hypothetical protein
MPLAPDAPFPKTQGNTIRSKDWNDVVNEIIRLDNAKVGRTGAERITGPLSVDTKLGIGLGANAADTTLHLAGGNWNTSTSEGDLKVGDGTYRFKVGVATGGGGAGDVRLRAQGGTNRLMLGSGTADVLTVVNGAVGVNTIGPAAALDVVGNVKLSGVITSPMLSIAQPLANHAGALPLNSSFVSGGGVMILFASGSGWGTAAVQIGMSVRVDNVQRGLCMSFTNEAGSHKAFVSNPIVINNLAAGNHTIQLVALAGTSTDFNDFYSVTVIELPLPQPGTIFVGNLGLGNLINVVNP